MGCGSLCMLERVEERSIVYLKAAINMNHNWTSTTTLSWETRACVIWSASLSVLRVLYWLSQQFVCMVRGVRRRQNRMLWHPLLCFLIVFPFFNKRNFMTTYLFVCNMFHDNWHCLFNMASIAGIQSWDDVVGCSNANSELHNYQTCNH